MRIIVSPAKKMNIDNHSLVHTSMPVFMPQTEKVLATLKTMSDEELKTLWGCNPNIAQLNIQRLQAMNLVTNLTPAVLSYDGIQYKYMAPSVFEDSQFQYIGQHLRIISAFYGLLRPFDGVVPYRLEMQAKLPIGEYKNLYQFWGKAIAKNLENETDFILNLASKEYSRVVSNNLLPTTKFVTCVFGQIIGGKIVEKGTLCKMARGEMVRWLAENRITDPNHIKDFNTMGYTYSSENSNASTITFIK